MSEAGVLLRIEGLPAFVVCIAFDEVHERRQPIGIVLPVKCKGFGGKVGIPFRIGLLPEEGTGGARQAGWCAWPWGRTRG